MYAAEDLYSRGLAVLSQLHRAGKVRLIVGTRSVQFELTDPGVLADYDIDSDDLREVSDDVADVLLAAISRVSAEVFSERRSSERKEYPDVVPESGEVARRKFDAATDAFDVDALRARRWLKRTSSVDVPHALDWEISEKHRASSGQDPEASLVTGVVNFVTEQSRHFYLPEFNKVTVLLDREDLDFLIDRLITMRNAWDAVEASKATEA